MYLQLFVSLKIGHAETLTLIINYLWTIILEMRTSKKLRQRCFMHCVYKSVFFKCCDFNLLHINKSLNIENLKKYLRFVIYQILITRKRWWTMVDIWGLSVWSCSSQIKFPKSWKYYCSRLIFQVILVISFSQRQDVARLLEQ